MKVIVGIEKMKDDYNSFDEDEDFKATTRDSEDEERYDFDEEDYRVNRQTNPYAYKQNSNDQPIRIAVGPDTSSADYKASRAVFSVSFGIFSIAASLLTVGAAAPIGIVLACVGLILNSDSKKRGYNGTSRKAGFVTCLIGLIINSLALVTCVGLIIGACSCADQKLSDLPSKDPVSIVSYYRDYLEDSLGLESYAVDSVQQMVAVETEDGQPAMYNNEALSDYMDALAEQ